MRGIERQSRRKRSELTHGDVNDQRKKQRAFPTTFALRASPMLDLRVQAQKKTGQAGIFASCTPCSALLHGAATPFAMPSSAFERLPTGISQAAPWRFANHAGSL